MSAFKPAPPHNRLLGPAVCLCVECSRDMLTRQCTAQDADGTRCGAYQGHRGEHTRLAATVFQIAEERAGEQTT